MGWRLRRSVKVLPGLRLNISKSGTSWSLGRRGASLNVGGKRGARMTVGVPGSGISFTSKVGEATPPPAASSSGSVFGLLGSLAGLAWSLLQIAFSLFVLYWVARLTIGF